MAPLNDKSLVVYAKDLNFAYGDKVIFSRADFHIPTGAKVALAGPNGSGKTTLIKMILGLEHPDRGSLDVSGWVKNIGYMPQAISDAGFKKNATLRSAMLSGRSLGRIAQRIAEINNKLSDQTGKAVLAELGEMQEKYEQADGYNADWQIESIFSGLCLPVEKLDQPVRILSGGMKTRLFLARLLFSNSDFLILDEPTNHLDCDAINWLGKYLHSLDRTVLIVSHQAEFLDEFCDHTLYLNAQTGQIETYRGNYSFCLQRRQRQADETAKQSKIQQKERDKLQDFINRWRAGSKAGQAQSRLKVLKKMKPVKVIRRDKKLSFKFPAVPRSGAVVLTVSKLTKSFARGPLFPPLNFAIARSDRVAVLGPNGSGKTSLLKIIAGQDPDYQGECQLGYSAKPGYYAQEFETLDYHRSSVEQLQNDIPRLTRSEMMSCLGHFLLAPQAEVLVKKLSQGEKARLALARLFLTGANLLILDEPTNHLDQNSRAALIEAISAYPGTIITVSHDLPYLRKIKIDKVIYVPQGRFINGDLDMIEPGWIDQ